MIETELICPGWNNNGSKRRVIFWISWEFVSHFVSNVVFAHLVCFMCRQYKFWLERPADCPLWIVIGADLPRLKNVPNIVSDSPIYFWKHFGKRILYRYDTYEEKNLFVLDSRNPTKECFSMLLFHQLQTLILFKGQRNIIAQKYKASKQ